MERKCEITTDGERQSLMGKQKQRTTATAISKGNTSLGCAERVGDRRQEKLRRQLGNPSKLARTAYCINIPCPSIA